MSGFGENEPEDPSLSQILRIRVSDVAVLAGLHDFMDASELVEFYLYQDLAYLALEDNECIEKMGYKLVSQIEEKDQLMKKVSKCSQQLLAEIEGKTQDMATMKSASDVSALKLKAETLISSEVRSKRLTSTEANVLLGDLKHGLNTTYGKVSEADILGEYEALYGGWLKLQCRVPGLAWALHIHSDGSVSPVDAGGIATGEVCRFRNGTPESVWWGAPSATEERNSPPTHTGSSPVRKRTTEGSRGATDFYLVGVPDAVASDCPDLREDQWSFLSVVIEVKARLSMRPEGQPAPLYDKIQALAYALMLGKPAADLVEAERGKVCAKRPRTASVGASTAPGSSSTAKASSSALPLQVHRIWVADARCPEQHGERFRSLVLPRLARFVAFIQLLRRQRDLRLSWRLAGAEGDECWALLLQHCPDLRQPS